MQRCTFCRCDLAGCCSRRCCISGCRGSTWVWLYVLKFEYIDKFYNKPRDMSAPIIIVNLYKRYRAVVQTISQMSLIRTFGKFLIAKNCGLHYWSREPDRFTRGRRLSIGVYKRLPPKGSGVLGRHNLFWGAYSLQSISAVPVWFTRLFYYHNTWKDSWIYMVVY